MYGCGSHGRARGREGYDSGRGEESGFAGSDVDLDDGCVKCMAVGTKGEQETEKDVIGRGVEEACFEGADVQLDARCFHLDAWCVKCMTVDIAREQEIAKDVIEREVKAAVLKELKVVSKRLVDTRDFIWFYTSLSLLSFSVFIHLLIFFFYVEHL